MKILFLDDDSTRHKIFTDRYKFHDIDVAYTAQECIELLEQNEYELLCLDHDLGFESHITDSTKENTGMEVVRWIERNRPKISEHIIVHSWNTAAGPVMASRLRECGYEASYSPFFPKLNLR